VDILVAMILDILDECDLRDNTIVVYTLDHGDMMGSHRLLAKTEDQAGDHWLRGSAIHPRVK
jgi:arylsulfatase A-like enzyme